MQLTPAQMQSLYEDGYLPVPGIIPREQLRAALRAINHSIGEGINPADLPTLRSQSYCPELMQAAVITNLFNRTPARVLAESLIGEGMLAPVTTGQIALRFPTLEDNLTEPQPHIDGMYTPTNAVPAGSVLNFTALAGVFLSDVPAENCGNFTVWPGTHRLHERYFREHGPQALLEGMPPIDLPPPLQLTARAGDVIIAHYLLGHAVAPNTSPNIRYACFFRLMHAHHDRQRWESMTDAWLQWPGVRTVLGGR